MKKKILIHFKSDKFFRVFNYSQLKKKLEKKYEVYFLLSKEESRFAHLVKKKRLIFYQKNLNYKLILKYPIKYLFYIFFRLLDVLLLKNINFESITYRYNLINKIGFQYIQKTNKNLKFDYDKEYMAGNFLNPSYGFPFSESKFLLNLFKKLFLSKYFIHPGFYDLLVDKKFDAVILMHLQSKEVFFIKKIIDLLQYKSINIIYGWDQPTLKGMLAANKKEKIIVTNNQIKFDLINYHSYNKSKIYNLGNYFLENLYRKRKKNNSKKFIIFYALTTRRISKNEIDTIQKIYNYFEKKKIKFKLILRPHPHDRYYYEELIKLKRNNLEIMKSTFYDIDQLIKKLNESNLIITNGTSMFLDARAMKKICATLLIDKNDTNLKKPYLRFFSYRNKRITYKDLDLLYKEYKTGILIKKNQLLDKYYLDPINKNITKNYLKFINDEISK